MTATNFSAVVANSSLQTTCDRLRSLTQQDRQPCWRCLPPVTAGEPVPIPTADAPLVVLNDRHQVAWAGGKTVLWLHQTIQWPEHLHQYPLAGMKAKLALRWWADQVDIFVNGEQVQSGDLFDCFTRISLSQSLPPGESVDVTLRLVSPGHDEGALVRSLLMFEAAAGDFPEPGFVADELTVLWQYLSRFAPERLPEVTAAVEVIDWSALPDRSRFEASLAHLRQQLMEFSPWLKQRQLVCLGHAHLDMAWLWPISDTWVAAERTFQSVLGLQADFPHLTYTHSSPALLAWLEVHRPELFQSVQTAVAAGRWVIDAGLWVEPELNLISGESIARQILYGQRYCQEKFGKISEIAWLPDSFGFCWQLPQLFLQGGIRCFATQKLRWNDTNPFPHELFWWQGLDGSRILSLTLPPIGADMDPVAMGTYAATWEAGTGISQALWLPGVGDHGGGPTRDMLEQSDRWAKSPLFPTLRFGHIGQFLREFAAGAMADIPEVSSESEARNLPVWNDELYLELHRGCYTTHADQKWYNRRCEDALYQAELFSAIAEILLDHPYPQAELEQAWKQVLFNQFHDILPGSAIPEVFTEANQNWQAALEVADDLRERALLAIAEAVNTPRPAITAHPEARPLLVFNALNWKRSEVVQIDLPPSPAPDRYWQLQDEDGHPIPTQIPASLADPERGSTALRFLAQDIPAIGYRRFWLVPVADDSAIATPPWPDHWQLENEYLRVQIDPATGWIQSLWHRPQQRETLAAPGNQLQTFRDSGQYWDAWNIAPDYGDHPQPAPQLTHLEWIEYGPVRQRLRAKLQFGRSTVIQDYVLDVASPVLKVEAQVDWQETQVLAKVAFPVAIAADHATYEIPFGAMARSTIPQTPQEQAKWEVPALRWADLGDGSFGLSLLTTSKHGFDATVSQLRLTLLKAPLWPDPQADRGHHHITYALYPHGGSWQTAHTVQQAHNLNQPLLTQLGQPVNSDRRPPNLRALAPAGSFFSLGSENLVLAAFKRSEEQTDQWVLRCYEAWGQPGELKLAGDLPLELRRPVDLLEVPLSGVAISATAIADQKIHQTISLQPWQVVTWVLETTPSTGSNRLE